MRSQSVLISGVGIAGPTLAYWLAWPIQPKEAQAPTGV